MPKRVLVSQAEGIAEDGRSFDRLDHAWLRLLLACDLVPVPVPNDMALVSRLWQQVRPAGLVVIGDGVPVEMGGEQPARDATAHRLLDFAYAAGVPVVGIDYGMQLMALREGGQWAANPRDIPGLYDIRVKGERISVQGSNPHIITDAGPAFSVWAQAIHDPSIEGVRHRDHPALGLAWRPDLPAKLQSRDIALIKGHFSDPSGRSR